MKYVISYFKTLFFKAFTEFMKYQNQITESLPLAEIFLKMKGGIKNLENAMLEKKCTIEVWPRSW